LWLLANPKAEVVMFDLWIHAYAPHSERYLRNASLSGKYGLVDVDKRLTIVKGSSLETVPQFFTEHPGFECDLLSVDGGHTYDIALKDIANMRMLRKLEYSTLVVDDTNCGFGYCVDAPLVEQERRRIVQPIARISEVQVGDAFGRGVTVLKYI
jgi:hypothetical protein